MTRSEFDTLDCNGCNARFRSSLSSNALNRFAFIRFICSWVGLSYDPPSPACFVDDIAWVGGALSKIKLNLNWFRNAGARELFTVDAIVDKYFFTHSLTATFNLPRTPRNRTSYLAVASPLAHTPAISTFANSYKNASQNSKRHGRRIRR